MWTELLLSVGVAALPVVGGVVGTAITSALHARNLDTTWFEAVSRAGGVAYNALLASGGTPTDRAALTKAAWAGADYMLERLPDQAQARVLNRSALASIVQAELGRLLARDPTVAPAVAPLSGPVPAPVTAPNPIIRDPRVLPAMPPR